MAREWRKHAKVCEARNGGRFLAMIRLVGTAEDEKSGERERREKKEQGKRGSVVRGKETGRKEKWEKESCGKGSTEYNERNRKMYG